MLSRSSSTAGDRLRRAKSNSSAHTSSSGHHHTTTSIDPFVTRQQAEAAAVEAYHRALASQEPAYQDYRPVPPPLQRRRSRASGRTEGSHFEDARLGRRRSNSKRDESSVANASRAKPLRQSDFTNDNTGEEKSITRKRSVIPPDPNNRLRQYDQSSSVPSSSRHARKSQSGYTDGSPLPRHSSALKERSSTLQIRTPRVDRSTGCSSSLGHGSSSYTAGNLPSCPNHTSLGLVPEQQTDEDVLAQARDRCLQDFQQNKLRERKSFILAPFQKRRATNVPKSSGSGYDTSLPPFNYAGESLPPPPPVPQELRVTTTEVEPERKTRNFSDTLKGRLKKVFRKTSRTPSGLPAQHVEGKTFHFSISSPVSTPNAGVEDEEDPFTVASHTVPVPEIRAESASSRRSVGAQSTAKSRVTSWTNSTVGGTLSTQVGTQNDDTADEHGRLKRSDSLSTLRKARSFFGRPISSRLRRPSKAQLQNSEESTGLYSALQQRIMPSDSASQDARNDELIDSRASSALATLPSQQRASSVMGNDSQWPFKTIRSVTPDREAYKTDNLTPVTEVMSPELAPQQPRSHSKHDEEQSESTPRSLLQRRPAMKAPTPSKEQLARRIERSKNRWQSPLDELSPPVLQITRAADAEDNPYELRSLSRTLQQPLAPTDLPHHAKVTENLETGRQDVLSPSVYSRGTDGASPRPDTPLDQGGMMVTITGREVRSYSISPRKRDQAAEQPVQGSQDWRRWLSGEMNGWGGSVGQEDFTLPKAILANSQPANVQVKTDLQTRDRQEAASPPLQAVSIEPMAPKQRIRRASFNLEKPHESSDARRVSSTAKTLRSAAEPPSIDSAIQDNDVNAEDDRPGSVITRPRILSERQSSALLEPSSRRNSALSHQKTLQAASPNEVSAPKAEQNTKLASKPKSAFDLRANYKNNNTGRPKPIAVRRRTENTENIPMLEDTTIRNISAGPYASETTASNNFANANNKENTSPPSEAHSLPAVSSSEWLAAGTNKKRDARKVSAVHPAFRDRSGSRYSPSRNVTSTVTGGGSSPGQRLVTNWLDGRKSKENSPAFV